MANQPLFRNWPKRPRLEWSPIRSTPGKPGRGDPNYGGTLYHL